MGDIVNLRRARKQRARAQARRSGDASAAAHGVSRNDWEAAARDRAKRDALLDGRRLDRDPPETRSGAEAPDGETE